MVVKRSGLRVVPWVDWEEWERFREKLQLGDSPSVAATLSLYRLRRYSTLPQAVQSTASLRMLLERRTDDYSRRLGLAMALVRLVNGATDRIQPRGEGSTARSVHSLAKVLCLPPILVELRHQATHNVLPRLDALEDGAMLALAWLEKDYWDPQGEAIASSLNTPRTCSNLDDATGTPHGGTWKRKAVFETPRDDSEPRRKRWRTSGSPESWKALPIGLLPGQPEAPRLIGVDISERIGRRWKAPGKLVSDAAPTSLPTEAAERVEEKPKGECTESMSGSVGRQTRVLNDEEKEAVQRMMADLESDDGND